MINFSTLAQKMIDTLKSKGIDDPNVRSAFSKIPRHLFVDEALRNRAYDDGPLPIGHGQTISQPYIVAFMIESLELQKSDRVLEIGSGSGYQTALLSLLVSKVYAIERISALTKNAQKILDELKIFNVYLRTFDGTLGWKDEAPFDAIIVAAAFEKIPAPYFAQLKIGGRLVIPVGNESLQHLMLITKMGDNEFEEKELCVCRFVKLIGEYGY